MKIIHIILGKANPYRMNGVNRVVYQLASNQTQLGMDVEVWGITRSSSSQSHQPPFTLRLFPDKGLFTLSERLIEELKEEVGAGKVVAHLHGGFIPVFFLLQKVLKKTGIEYAFTPHGTYSHGALRGRSYWIKRIYSVLFEKSVVRNARFVQCLGHMEEEDTKKLFSGLKTIIIPNGIDEKEILGLSLGRRNNKVPVFGFCGRLASHHKGLDLMIEGFAEYKKQMSCNGKLVLVGEGPDRPKLVKQIEKHGLSDSVIFTGPLYGAEKYKRLNTFDFFLHTSRHEGLPVAVLEAFLLGIPSLVTRATSLEPYIRRYHAGIGLGQGSVQQIAEGFSEANRIWKTEEYNKSRVNARTLAAWEFNWSRIAQQLIQAYGAKAVQKEKAA